VTLAAIRHGRGPGREISPWTMRGIRAALAPWGAEVQVTQIPVHERPEAYAAETLRLLIRGSWASVPRSWLGTSLCLVTPLVLADARWSARGPVCLGLAAVARACGLGLSWPRGHDLVLQVFAAAILVIDATWSHAWHREPFSYSLSTVNKCAAVRLAADGASPPQIDRWAARAFDPSPSLRRTLGIRPGYAPPGSLAASWPARSAGGQVTAT
jgi:hypothetical protein